MIFKQETIKSWFTGVGNSINNEVVQPFQNANSIINKYNLAIQHNSLTQQGWQRLLAQSDDSLKAYLTSIKGTTASMSGYNVSLQGNITGFTKITKAMQQYNALGATSQKEQQAFATAVSATNTKLGSYLTGLNGAKASLSGYGLSLIASTAKTVGLTVATTALNATLTMGISLIVSGLISAFVSWIHKSEEIAEKAQEAADKINSINDSLKSNTETVENAKKRYAELAQEVENLGKITQSQGTLSNEEYAEFLDLSNQLAEIFPSLTKNYDANGNAILGLSGNVNTIVSSLDSLIQKEKDLANQKIMEEFPDVFKGWNQDLSDAEQKAKSAKTEFDKINNAYQQLSNGTTSQAFDLQRNGWFTNENGEKITISMNEYISNLEALGLEYEETQIKVKNQFGGDTLSGYLIKATGDIDTAFTSKLEKAREDLQYAQQQLEGQTSSINQYLNTWLQDEFSYVQIEDSGLQTAIQDMLFNFDWDNIPEDKRGDWNYVSEYLRRNILFEINKVQDDPVISKAISEIFTNAELTPDEKSNYLQQIRDFFGEDSAVTISLKPQIEENEALQRQYDKAIEDTKKKFDGYDPTAFFKEHSINTQEKIDAWRKIVECAESATETEKEYLNQERTNNIPALLSLSDTVTQLNTKLKPAMDSLHSAWQDMFNDDGKFDLKSVDILSTCDTIKSKLDEMSDPEGLNLDVDYSAFEDFVRVLNNTESTEQDVENAFDSLATSITQAALTGAEDFETMKDALEDLGVVNNEMVAFQALASNTEMLEQALSEANASMDDFIVNTEDGSVEATKAGQAFLEEKAGAENCAEALNILAFHKELCNLQEMNTAGEVANLKTLAENAGYTGEVIQYLTEMEQIYQEVASGTLTPTQIGFKLARAVALKAMIEGAASQVQYAPKVDWSGAVKDAGKAGKDSGKSYKDKLKEQLSDLEGVISGVTGRIDDQISSINEQKSAALDSIDAQKEAIESAKESAVEALEAERDARLEVIETQKAQLEEQIKLIDKQIKQKQDEIDAINEAAEARKRELDLQKAQYELERMQNQRTILQYSENKGMHYVNDSKGIRDAKEKVDDAKRQIEIANIQKEIDLLEDQKDLLNEQIDLLDEQADAVNKYYDEQIKQTEKYYDSLIKNLEKQRKETEAYYESLTKSLEQRKDKFQELTEILEKAELSAKLKQLGIDEEALLNGSEEEFNKLKDAYMNIVFQLNEGNDEVLNKLRELSGYEGTAPAMFEESNTKLGTMNDELGTANTEVGNVNSSLTETASTTSDVATNVSDVNTNIGETVGLVNDEKGAFDDLKQTIDLIVEAINQKIQAIETGQSTVASAVGSEMANFQLLINKILEVKEKLDEVNNTVTTMERQPVDNLANAFQLLYDKLLLVSNLLGVGVEGEGAVNGISGAIQALNEISLEEGIIAQFTNLKTAIDSVTAAISGGGGESSEGEGSGGGSGSSGGKQGSKGGSGSKGGKGSEGESGGGGNSLTGAIKSMGETAKEVIGEPDAEGDGTVIGEFGSMETAVNDVRDAIGTEGSAGGEGGKSGSGGKGESDDTLVGSIEYLGDKTDEEMGESDGDGIIGRFEQFRDVIGEADEHVKSISDGLDNIDGKEVSCTIHVNIETSGGTGFTGSAQVLGSMNLNSATYNAQYQGKAHYEGTAEVTGDWGVKKSGTTLVGELGQELIVFPNGRFKTVGDNGAEFVDIPANSIVFNHLQTRELLSKGNIVGRGRALASGTALANGTANKSDDSIWTTLADGTKVRPLQPGDKMYDMVQKFDAYFKSMDGNLEKLVPNSLYEHQRQMEDMAKQINYVSSVVNNNRNVQQPVVHQQFNITMPNVTDSTSAASLMNDLQSIATKKYQVDW